MTNYEDLAAELMQRSRWGDTDQAILAAEAAAAIRAQALALEAGLEQVKVLQERAERAEGENERLSELLRAWLFMLDSFKYEWRSRYGNTGEPKEWLRAHTDAALEPPQ